MDSEDLEAGVGSGFVVSLEPSQVKEGACRPWERRTEHSKRFECVQRLLSRRGSGVRIRPPVKSAEPPVVGARWRGSANIPSPAPLIPLFSSTRYGCNEKATEAPQSNPQSKASKPLPIDVTSPNEAQNLPRHRKEVKNMSQLRKTWSCHYCGKTNRRERRTCYNCGHKRNTRPRTI